MIHHHRQAIELSQNVRSHDDVEARVSSAARFIIQDQKNEITTMRAWLQAWDNAHDGHEHDPDMPGMLAQARVDEVAELATPAAEVAFLRAMIEHHEGAIEMSQAYLPVQTNAFVRSTATHIITEQTTEIRYLRGLLEQRCATDGPATCPGP